MATNGPVAIQGCAFRIARLAETGSIVDSSTGLVQDDRSFVKLTAKPNMADGVTITPISACGVPVISYKDCDRYKRWTVQISFGDWDPELMELVGQGQVITASGSAGRTVANSVLVLNENTLTSATGAFTTSDVGRSVTPPAINVATCVLVTASKTVTTSASFTSSGIVAGMPVTGTGIAATTVVTRVTSATQLTLSKAATSAETSETLHFYQLPAGTYISEIVSSTEVRLSEPALKSGTGLSVVLGAQPVSTIGYQYPRLLEIACPFGVSIEVWEKAIVRGTGYQGTTPYPSAGTPTTPGSPYIRTGIFRAFLYWDAFAMENKERETMLRGWAIENPNFGTGPNDDWRNSGLPGVGSAITTQGWCNTMADFELPSPLQPGYQTTPG